ncbi:uncharacterized protein KNAG_0B01230 [Huiozyma naganishii CBS 8797]|uniref:Uncharacterized protein n=1 Tax=Huiozyma naganishii (strain ATCC MYA-139 / BCRC 22969 / CBS 8797 / KCTC 17520 / NBRC 10181 / NCYC 3082 / Yp74L-3) TaxID=1071383 RepID=J7R196_HUIN7|nr:hypothetical protein KNAG_0B01230 [Kazachstania naganishii CBS 8797]CCK68570.1 hypothetical protein KNAG_0B01230 [Kazachstania naganishii CBS 8797]
MDPSTATKKFKSSQFLNKIITKDDITPLSRGKTGISSKENNGAEGSVRHNVIVDSIPTSESSHVSDTETVDSAAESDSLFSPLSSSLQVNDFQEEDMYENFGSFANGLEKFPNYDLGCLENNTGSKINNFGSLNAGLVFENTEVGLPLDSNEMLNNDEFWKEVTLTDEEAIFFENNHQDTQRRNSVMQQTPQDISNTCLEDFVSDDLLSPMNKDWADNLFNDSQYKVKLLCYRDADGNLSLKTRSVPQRTVSTTAGTGFIGKKKLNKRKKLLKKCIRRNSGVGAMISTGVGMNEFML